jgi:hypothetical protein
VVVRQDDAQQQHYMREVFKVISKRDDKLCNFVEGGPWGDGTRIVYRHYATLYFVFCVDDSESELGILDLIQVFVEALDKCFENVCELDLVFHMDRVCATRSRRRRRRRCCRRRRGWRHCRRCCAATVWWQAATAQFSARRTILALPRCCLSVGALDHGRDYPGRYGARDEHWRDFESLGWPAKARAGDYQSPKDCAP